MVLFYLTGSIALILILIFIYFTDQKTRKKQSDIHTRKLNELQKSLDELQNKLAALNEQQHRTNEDPVTGLVGQHLFDDRLKQSIRESTRYHFTMGVLFVSINDFDVINNALNTEMGNAVLKEAARRLQSCLRQVDSISRVSQDTFAILLAQITRPEIAAVIAQRILQAMAGVFKVDGHELHLTANIGITIYPADGQDAERLLDNAKQALTLARQKAKHNYQFYQEQMHHESQRTLVLYTGLSQESIFEKLSLLYQPIFNVEKQTIFCMEVSLQWQHAELGLIPQQELFSHAEKQQKINQISEWMLRRACQQFLHWRSFDFKPALLAMPLSVKQLESSQFVYQLSYLLQELNFKPEWLLLELSEHESPISFDVLEKSFNMLKYLGIQTALNHFGDQAFSSRYLKNFYIHYLKLDHSFVDTLLTDLQTKALVKSIVGLADNLSMQVIAEGVELEPQLLALKEFGCVLMQGDLLGVPLANQEIEKQGGVRAGEKIADQP